MDPDTKVNERHRRRAVEPSTTLVSDNRGGDSAGWAYQSQPPGGSNPGGPSSWIGNQYSVSGSNPGGQSSWIGNQYSVSGFNPGGQPSWIGNQSSSVRDSVQRPGLTRQSTGNSSKEKFPEYEDRLGAYFGYEDGPSGSYIRDGSDRAILGKLLRQLIFDHKRNYRDFLRAIEQETQIISEGGLTKMRLFEEYVSVSRSESGEHTFRFKVPACDEELSHYFNVLTARKVEEDDEDLLFALRKMLTYKDGLKEDYPTLYVKRNALDVASVISIKWVTNHRKEDPRFRIGFHRNSKFQKWHLHLQDIIPDLHTQLEALAIIKELNQAQCFKAKLVINTTPHNLEHTNTYRH